MLRSGEVIRPAIVHVLAIAVVLGLPPKLLLAQSTFAPLTGIVTDSSGAVLPGTTITIKNAATGVERLVVSEDAGQFQVTNLDAGTYEMLAHLDGFADLARRVELLARQTVRADLQLQIAGTAERIEVSAVRPVIETERAAIDSSTSGDDISKLALNFRATNNTSPIAVATLTQGVQQDRAGSISLASALPFMTSFSVDGISTQRVRYGGPSKDLFPSVESNRRAQGDAREYERRVHAGDRHHVDNQERDEPGAWHRFLVQPGQCVERVDAIHAPRRFRQRHQARHPGEQLWHFRRRADRPEPRILLRDLRGARRPNEETLGQIVPPDAWRAGDLSSVSSPILNPATGQPFPNNQIPINAVSARILAAFYERQNQPTGSATGAPNYIINPPGDFSVDGIDGRVDYNLSANQKVFGRMTWKNVEISGATGNWNTKQGDPFRRTEVRQLAASHNWVHGALVNELRGGWSNTVEKDNYANALEGPGLVESTGLVGLPGPPGTGGFPHFQFNDGSFISTGGVKPFDILSRVVQGSDTVTWLAGRHTIKTGVDIQYVEYRDQISFFDGEELGRYEFDGSYREARSPTFYWGCRISPATSCPRPT